METRYGTIPFDDLIGLIQFNVPTARIFCVPDRYENKYNYKLDYLNNIYDLNMKAFQDNPTVAMEDLLEWVNALTNKFRVLNDKVRGKEFYYGSRT